MPKKAPEKIGSVLRVPLSQLHPHPKNPFAVRDDSAMQELKESVSQNGVLVPAIARPRAEGGYELIAGHRRKYACEQAGQDFMPVIVLNLNDDEAVRGFITMNKIEKLNESIRALFRSEGEKFCYTPGEIERLVCSLNYKRLYSVLCDTAEPVYVCCAGGGICDSHQYHSTKLFPANATLIWSDESEPLGDDNISTSYSNELWLLEDMTIAATSCFRVLNSAASYITEYREYKGDEWPAHLVPVNILELWQSLIDKYQDCGDEELDATLKAIIYEP